MKIIILYLTLLVGICSCDLQEKETTYISNIDRTLQSKVTYILKNKLSELNALSGQAIIMEVQTGQIKAMVGLEKKIVQTTNQVRIYLKHKLWD